MEETERKTEDADVELYAIGKMQWEVKKWRNGNMRKCRRRTDTIRTKELNIFEESRNKMMKNIETTEVRLLKDVQEN